MGTGVGGDVVGLAVGVDEGPELRLGALLGEVLPEGAKVFAAASAAVIARSPVRKVNMCTLAVVDFMKEVRY